MRVVLDTNILISACWKQDGLEGRTVGLGAAGAFVPCVTAEMQKEYREVLSRKKFAALQATADRILSGFVDRCLLVAAGTPVHAASDEDDNRFLECAEAAGAAYLVTGNLRHYPEQWGGTKVVNARQFLAAEFGAIAPTD